MKRILNFPLNHGGLSLENNFDTRVPSCAQDVNYRKIQYQDFEIIIHVHEFKIKSSC